MEKVVADASVIVKWFIEESYSEKALVLRDMHVNGEIQLIAPSILPFEVLNALKYSNLFNEEELQEVANAISKYGFEYYNLRGELAEKTVELALENEITIYDASYIALAVLKKTKFYTADEKLIKKTKKAVKGVVFHIKQI